MFGSQTAAGKNEPGNTGLDNFYGNPCRKQVAFPRLNNDTFRGHTRP